MWRDLFLLDSSFFVWLLAHLEQVSTPFLKLLYQNQSGYHILHLNQHLSTRTQLQLKYVECLSFPEIVLPKGGLTTFVSIFYVNFFLFFAGSSAIHQSYAK